MRSVLTAFIVTTILILFVSVLLETTSSVLNNPDFCSADFKSAYDNFFQLPIATSLCTIFGDPILLIFGSVVVVITYMLAKVFIRTSYEHKY